MCYIHLQRSGRVSTISQVTAAQIHSAVESGENDFKIDGREVGMVRSSKFNIFCPCKVQALVSLRCV